jgi:hypothetical protein
MEKETKREQEIDLLELGAKSIKGIGNLIDYFKHLITSFFYFFLRNGLAFSIVMVLGVIAGGVTYKLKRQYYHSEMIAYTSIAANSEIVKSVNNWNYMREFSKEDAEKIKDVTSSFLLDVNGDGEWDVIEDMKTIDKLDTTLGQRVRGAFAVMIDAYDTSMIIPVKKKLMKFLFQNEKIELRNKERIIMLDRQQRKIGEQIVMIDSLQKFEYYRDEQPSIMRSNDMFFLQKKDKRLYHKDILELYKEKIEIQRDIAVFRGPYDIRVDFEIPRRGSVILLNEIIKNVIIFLILGLIFIFFWDRWKIVQESIRLAKEEKLD